MLVVNSGYLLGHKITNYLCYLMVGSTIIREGIQRGRGGDYKRVLIFIHIHLSTKSLIL